MQPPRRQIIKTRPQRPYTIARFILILIALAAIVLTALSIISHRQPSHAAQLQTRTALRQEAHFADRKMPIQLSIASRRSNAFDHAIASARSSRFDRSKGAQRS